MSDTEDEIDYGGHAAHFLGRLERANVRQADLALRLYRDPALVKFILDDGALKAEAPASRVALPLGPGATAKIIVTREGAFVTCLGADMDATDLSRLEWERMEMRLVRAEATRDEWRLAQSTLDEVGSGKGLHRLLFAAGSALTREEFSQLVALAPIYETFYATTLAGLLIVAGEVLPAAARVRGRDRESLRLLREGWNVIHAVGHLMVLAALPGRRGFAKARDAGHDVVEHIYLRFARTAHGPLAMRALWGVARAGREAMPAIKRGLTTATDRWAFLQAAVAAVAVGTAHRRLRAEAAAYLSPARIPTSLRSAAAEALIDVARSHLAPLADDRTAVEDAEYLEEDAPNPAPADDPRWRQDRELFADILVAAVPGRSPTQREAARAAFVADPDQHLVPAFANSPLDVATDDFFTTLLSAMPLIARARPESLYLPAADMKHFGVGFDPERMQKLALRLFPRPDTVRAAPRPGRNDPCSCGSGKKYKKCCG